MKCPYCQTELVDIHLKKPALSSVIKCHCEDCNAIFRWDATNNNQLFSTDLMLMVNGREYNVWLYHRDRCCFVFDDDHGTIISLDFVPDWTPSNIKDKLQSYLLFL